MSALRIFITGGSGALGFRLIEAAGSRYEILAGYRENPVLTESVLKVRLDLTDKDSIEKVFLSFKPNIVIHTAAVTSPFIAQRLSPDKVNGINVKATEDLTVLCGMYDAKLIFISTDLVYDGDAGSFRDETSALNPISVYAESKVAAEKIILRGASDFLILRNALMIELNDRKSDNFFHYTFNKLKRGESIKLFSDQFRTPIAVFDAARIVFELIEKDVNNEIINVGGTSRLSRLDLGMMLCDVCGFRKELISGNSIYEAEKIHRVRDVSLDVSKLGSYGIDPLNIRESISRLVNGY